MDSDAKNAPESHGVAVKKLHIEGLNQKERRLLITKAFQQLPHDLSYGEKLQHMSKCLDMRLNGVQQMGKRWKFREWDLEQRIEAEATAAPVATLLHQSDAPFSTAEFLAELRQFTRRAVDASSRFTRCTALMIEMYSQRLEAKVLTTPNPTEVDYMEMELIYDRLSTYMNRAKSFMTPQAVASLLNAMRFGDNLPPEVPAGVDTEAFTVAGLQRTLSKMGVSTLFDDPEAIETAFAPYRDQIPSIEGIR